MESVVESAFPPAEVLWPDAESGPWVLRVDIDLVDGRPQPVGLNISSADPAVRKRLSAIVLRRIKLPEIVYAHLSEYRAGIRSRIESITADVDIPRSVTDEWEALHADAAAVDRRPGRPAYLTADDHQHVADLYRAAHEAGEPVLATIQNALHLSPSAAAKRVSVARTLGLLPPTTRGKARAAADGDK